jgi:lipid II:glycine glycyltransferase (peptidoglycan interpeptide bridge formation enzyme)
MPELRSVVPAELARCDAAASFLQSGFWGSFKAGFGWNARAFLADWGDGGKLPLLAIRRRLGRLASFAYVPWGPELPAGIDSDEDRSAALTAIATALKGLLPPDTAFIRFDPPWASTGVDAAPPRVLGRFRRAGADIQPPDTVVIDLEPDEAAILAAMKPKWRYNIRLAEKRGVVVRRPDAAGLDEFYRLLKSTGRRDGIAVHAKEYYAALFEHAAAYGRGAGAPADAGGPEASAPEALALGQEVRLYLAEAPGQAAGEPGENLAAAIVLLRGAEATYLYGASADSRRELMPAYALQWRAMRDAKASGGLSYDLFGIPPNDDPDHPMSGLYRFKTGFGGSVLHRPGSWDYAYKPAVAGAFKLAEAARKAWRDRRKLRRKGGAAGD